MLGSSIHTPNFLSESKEFSSTDIITSNTTDDRPFALKINGSNDDIAKILDGGKGQARVLASFDGQPTAILKVPREVDEWNMLCRLIWASQIVGEVAWLEQTVLEDLEIE